MAGKPTHLRRRIAPSVQLTLHEEQFTLCLDGDALCALESRIPSLNTLNLGGLEIFRQMTARVLVTALWAALLRHHPEYDTVDAKTGVPTSDGLNAVGSFVDSSNMHDVVKGLEQAYLVTLPQERAEEIRKLAEKGKELAEAPEAPANPPAAGAPESTDGSTIGASAATTSDLAIAKPAGSA